MQDHCVSMLMLGSWEVVRSEEQGVCVGGVVVGTTKGTCMCNERLLCKGGIRVVAMS